MYKGYNFLAVIPARGGSKGIPHKNIVDVNGKPLIQYTIDEALSSKFLDKVIVSTDDYSIAKISKGCGADVPFLRPSQLASDQAKTIDVLIHAISMLEDNGEHYDYLVLLQPTQPLRKSWHIDEAIEKIVEHGIDNLVSLSEVKEHPILVRTINKDGLVNNLLETSSTVRRQDFPPYFKVNGAIYINKLGDTFNSKTSLNDNKLAYVMDKEFDLDIDEQCDLDLLKMLFK